MSLETRVYKMMLHISLVLFLMFGLVKKCYIILNPYLVKEKCCRVHGSQIASCIVRSYIWSYFHFAITRKLQF